MIRSPGKLIIYVLLVNFWIFGIYALPSVELQLLSSLAISLQEVSIGVPFTLKVIVKNEQPVYTHFEIDELHNFSLLYRSSQNGIISFNGQALYIQEYTYTLVAKQVGYFTLGPARFTAPPGLISNTCTLNVSAPNTHTLQSNEPVCYQLLIEKKQAYISEKIPFTLRFIYTKKNMHITKLQSLTDANIGITAADPLIAREVIINNKLHKIIEQNGIFSLEKSGKVVIPELSAYYNTSSLQHTFFGINSKKKELYTRPIELHILPLPGAKNQAQAVGTFSSFSAQINKHEIACNQAVALTLTLTGDAFFQQIGFMPLELPEGLKYYESKENIMCDASGESKHFEYIIQGIKPGSWVIPAQVFTYFDPKDQTYKQLKTEPLSIEITANSNNIGNSQETTELDISQEFENTESEINGENFQIQIPVVPASSGWAFSALIFCLLLALPIAVKCIFFLYKLVYTKSRCIFLAARKALYKAQKCNNKADVYLILKKAYIGLLCQEDHSITDQDLAKILAYYGLPKATLLAWQDFNHKAKLCSLYAPENNFYDYDICKELNSYFFDQAQNWLSKIYHFSKTINSKVASKKNIQLFIIANIFVSCCLFSPIVCCDIPACNVAALRELKHVQRFLAGKEVFVIQNSINKNKELCKNTTFELLPYWYLIIYAYIAIVPFIIWQLLCIISWWILIFKRPQRIIYCVCLIMMCALSGLGILVISWMRYKPRGIIKEQQVQLYFGPSEMYPAKADIAIATEVYVVKSCQSWHYVKTSTISGWIPEHNIMMI